ncbi:MAG: PhoH family protein [Candidatus Micrarchaeota archaeon]|nr:PhoH family protein [Candidatus Micrarchaeota archaeon]MCX8154806.1 PhoH family protein [Candidatus Micrarchaeota archaeon]
MIKIGIREFDQAIAGLYDDDIILITGPSGTGKTILSLITAVYNIKLGNNVMYVLLGTDRKGFMKSVKFLEYPLEKYTDNKFMLIEFPTADIYQFLDPNDNPLMTFIEEYNIKLVVIDQIDRIITSQDAVDRFFQVIRSWGIATILISNTTQYHIENYCDVWISMDYRDIKERRKKVFEVIKSRGRNHSNQKFIFDIYEDGITIKEI